MGTAFLNMRVLVGGSVGKGEAARRCREGLLSHERGCGRVLGGPWGSLRWSSLLCWKNESTYFSHYFVFFPCFLLSPFPLQFTYHPLASTSLHWCFGLIFVHVRSRWRLDFLVCWSVYSLGIHDRRYRRAAIGSFSVFHFTLLLLHGLPFYLYFCAIVVPNTQTLCGALLLPSLFPFAQGAEGGEEESAGGEEETNNTVPTNMNESDSLKSLKVFLFLFTLAMNLFLSHVFIFSFHIFFHSSKYAEVNWIKGTLWKSLISSA